MKRLVASDRIQKPWPSAAVLAAVGAICCLVVIACREDSDPATAWDGTVRDSAGIEIVENFGRPLWPEGPGWEFTQDLRIGAVDGPPEYEFGHITGFQVLSDGRIVIVDAMAYKVRFFSPEGVHERSVGRQGQGPGELGTGSHLLLRGPGDTLLVDDGGARRIHVLAPDGTWLETFSRLPKDGYEGGYWSGSSRTGRLTSLHSPLRQSDGTLTDTLDIVLERDVHGGIVDTIARLPSRYTFYRGDAGTFRRYYNAAWWHMPWGEGHVIARSDRYRFLWYGPDGQLRRIMGLAREPTPITEQDRAVFMERWEEYLQERSVPVDRWSEIKSAISFADSYPPYCTFRPGPAGTLLVERVRPARALDSEKRSRLDVNQQYVPPGSSEWDVFDSEGHYLGGVVIPETEWTPGSPRPTRFFRDPAADTWYMYSIWSDELGVEYIVRWRIDGRMPA
ncbi:MAG: hypothetical protein JSV86_07070 [Gemmatimonadota bacterium]|nr:MAG: hypothetical protein JSV86_07070 [Gemmatimonadota bacterium]